MLTCVFPKFDGTSAPENWISITKSAGLSKDSLEQKLKNNKNTYHMFGQIGLDGKLDSAKVAAELAFAFVVSGLFVVFQSGSITEHGGAFGALNDLSDVSSSNVTVETGPTSEFRIALIAFEGFLTRMRLDVTRQSLLVLKGRAAL